MKLCPSVTSFPRVTVFIFNFTEYHSRFIRIDRSVIRLSLLRPQILVLHLMNLYHGLSSPFFDFPPALHHFPVCTRHLALSSSCCVSHTIFTVGVFFHLTRKKHNIFNRVE